MKLRLLRWDGAIVLLCYFCAFWLCASPIIPYEFQTDLQLLAGAAILGTPLAAIGLWLNHKAEKSETTKS